LVWPYIEQKRKKRQELHAYLRYTRGMTANALNASHNRRIDHNTISTHTERLLPILVYIQANLDQDLALGTLATLANLSSYHFHRLFRATVGETLKQYVQRLRLEQAAYRKNGTRVNLVAEANATGLKKLMLPLIVGFMKKEDGDHLKSLKAAIERPKAVA
jgi:transcriptional regulator GlxA family with amidase domain